MKIEVRVRDMGGDAVAKIDDLARAEGKSRNEFLKQQLTLLAAAPEIAVKVDQYKNLVDYVAAIVERNNKLIRELIRLLESE
jgi:hypothetical protein